MHLLIIFFSSAQTDTWRRLVFKCELYADGSEEPAEEFIKITKNEQLISTVSSGVGYFVKVRACWNSVCSSFVNSSSTAFAPYQQGKECFSIFPTKRCIFSAENPVIAYTNTGDKLQALGILGEKLTSVVVNRKQLVCAVTSIRVLSAEKLPKKSDESVVFDPLTGNIYRSNMAQVCLYRVAHNYVVPCVGNFQVSSAQADYTIRKSIKFCIYTCFGFSSYYAALHPIRSILARETKILI
jgi:hypothetical protein